VLLITVVVGVAMFIGSMLVNKLIRPFRLYSREDREKQQIESRYLTLKKNNIKMRRQLKYMVTPQGKVELARKQGYVKPGERAIVISDEESQDEKTTP